MPLGKKRMASCLFGIWIVGAITYVLVNIAADRNEAAFADHANSVSAVVVDPPMGEADSYQDVWVRLADERLRRLYAMPRDAAVGEQVTVLVDRNDADRMELPGSFGFLSPSARVLRTVAAFILIAPLLALLWLPIFLIVRAVWRTWCAVRHGHAAGHEDKFA